MPDTKQTEQDIIREFDNILRKQNKLQDDRAQLRDQCTLDQLGRRDVPVDMEPPLKNDIALAYGLLWLSAPIRARKMLLSWLTQEEQKAGIVAAKRLLKGGTRHG